MWRLTRSTLFAGVYSSALHIVLLGLAASIAVTLPRPLPVPVHVTLVQRAVPLSTGELAKGESEPNPAPVPQPPPPAAPRAKRIAPRPVVQKKPRPILPHRRPKPLTQPQPVLPSEPPPVVNEEPPLITVETPPAPVDVESVPEQDLARADGQFPTGSDEAGQGSDQVNGSGAGAPHDAGGNGSGQSKGTGGAGGVSASPNYNINPKPPYPLLARRVGAQGEVVLRVLVRPDGSVATVELARSSGFSLLDESATRTVREQWRFIPAQLNGASVESWVEVPIKFVLAES